MYWFGGTRSDKHTKTRQLNGLVVAWNANTDLGRFVLVTKYLPLAIKKMKATFALWRVADYVVMALHVA